MKHTSKEAVKLTNHLAIERFQMEATVDMRIHDRRPITKIAEHLIFTALKHK